MISDFAKEKVFWTRKMNLKLVKFIESRPNIWNPKHPKYTSVAYRDRTYADFAYKYGNEFTWQAVKDRWTNIRSTFATYLRKSNASRARGDSEEYKVNWHLWNACKFLLKVNKKNMRSIKLSENCNNEDGIDYLNQPCGNEAESQQDCKDMESFEDLQHTNNLSCDDIVQNLMIVFQNIQNDAIDCQNSKYSEVGRMVAKKLSAMNSYEAAVMINKITEILLLYDENSVVNPNNMKSEKL